MVVNRGVYMKGYMLSIIVLLLACIRVRNILK